MSIPLIMLIPTKSNIHLNAPNLSLEELLAILITATNVNINTSLTVVLIRPLSLISESALFVLKLLDEVVGLVLQLAYLVLDAAVVLAVELLEIGLEQLVVLAQVLELVLEALDLISEVLLSALFCWVGWSLVLFVL